MATFSIDLITGKPYLFSGDFTNSGMTTFSGVTSVINGLSMVTSRQAKLGGALVYPTILTKGGINIAGVEYGGDYSASFSNRSLVDKGYVDNKVSGSTPNWNTLTNRPAWLTGTTLSAFQLAHSHSQYLTNSIFQTYTGTTAPGQFANKANAITGATNLGSGQGIYTSVSANKVQLKSLKAAGSVSISTDSTSITLSGSTPAIPTWSTLSGRPAWLTGTTLQMFQTGHTHSYNKLTNKLSGGTGIEIINNVIIATGGTATSWAVITNKPSWLSGITLQAFQTGHTHGQYLTASALNGYWTSAQTTGYLSTHFWTSGQTISYINGRNFLTGVTWSQVTSKPSWVGSGETTVTFVGNQYRIYTPSDISANWSTLSGRPYWLTGTTIQAFQTGHTHSYTNLSNKLVFIESGVTIVTQNGSNVNIYVPPTNVTLQLIDNSGNSEVNTITATTISWTTQEFSGTTFNFTGGSKIRITENGIYGIGYTLNFINEDAAPKNIGTVIRKNGNTVIAPTTSALLSTFPYYSAVNIMSIYKTNLLVNDYVELIAYRIGDAGSALTIPGGSWITVIKYNT